MADTRGAGGRRRFGGLLPGIEGRVAQCMSFCQEERAALAWRGAAGKRCWLWVRGLLSAVVLFAGQSGEGSFVETARSTLS